MKEFRLIDDVMPDVLPPDPGTVAEARARMRRVRRGRPHAWAGVLVAAAATVAVIGAVTLTPKLGDVPGPPRAAGPIAGDSVAIPLDRASAVPGDVRTDTEHSPPQRLIAAGSLAVSAYSIQHWETVSGDLKELRRTWYLYNPGTGAYEETAWQWLDVAPGLRLAAVLEGDLPSKRLGILDMSTRKVLTWIELGHPAAGLAWSPDGRRILATSYGEHPDRVELVAGDENQMKRFPSTRTGFSIVDVATRQTRFTALGPLTHLGGADGGPTNMNARQDLEWNLDGSLIWGPTDSHPDRVFYDLHGQPHATPPETYVEYSKESAVSPDGTRVITGRPLRVEERTSGKTVGRPRVLQLLAWADDDQLIGVGCAGECAYEHRNGLVLVSADGKKSTQLSGFRENDKVGRWEWLLTRR
ncbi:hypothetical protein GCM10022226_56540 [Sphaerisporangium flaviroseum]|uniref:WD40 repeat domain-containing protein n=1 Tax=Sphaerisporangium flaviroseum TaxID=509199 RepID=A0ABP7IVW6_9ACTN